MRKGQEDEMTLRSIRRAHDVLEGCLVSLSISESAKGILREQLRILYEFSMYPMVVPGTRLKATSRQQTAYEDASPVGGGIGLIADEASREYPSDENGKETKQ